MKMFLEGKLMNMSNGFFFFLSSKNSEGYESGDMLICRGGQRTWRPKCILGRRPALMSRAYGKLVMEEGNVPVRSVP